MESKDGWLMTIMAIGSGFLGHITSMLRVKRDATNDLLNAQNLFQANTMLEIGRLRQWNEEQAKEMDRFRQQLVASEKQATEYERQIAEGKTSVVELTRLLGQAKQRITDLETQLRFYTAAPVQVPAPGTVATTHIETIVTTPPEAK